MLFLKPEVKEAGVSPEIWYAIGVASAIKQDILGQALVVTALTDGEHNPGSLHPLGLAVDLRTKDMLEDQAQLFYEEVKKSLEPLGYDIVWEGVGATPATTQRHVHIEFQPKGQERFINRAP